MTVIRFPSLCEKRQRLKNEWKKTQEKCIRVKSVLKTSLKEENSYTLQHPKNEQLILQILFLIGSPKYHYYVTVFVTWELLNALLFIMGCFNSNKIVFKKTGKRDPEKCPFSEIST